MSNTGDRPIQVGSHTHFFEVNRGLPAQLLAQALPLTHFLRIVRGITLKGADFADIAPEVAWLAVILVALVALSSLRFRKKLV